VYQDLVDEMGQTLAPGYRECEKRYELIRQVVEPLRRPFTVLDLGANAGYFSIRLTQDYGARCVAVEPMPDIKKAEGRVAAIVNRAVTPDDVHRLGTFDVVLGLSVLHHMKYWRKMLEMMNSIARSVLIIETPSCKERLKKAVACHELPMILSYVQSAGLKKIGSTPAVWQRDVMRPMYAITRNGLPTRGEVFSGSGQNGIHTSQSQNELATVLGYEPYPGSLNLRTKWAFRLGAYTTEFVDSRGRGGRRGGDYQIWHARVDGFDGPAHVFRPGRRSHGRYVLEVWAPVNLREHLGLKDGSMVRLRIGA
jgi:hypothetical protein